MTVFMTGLPVLTLSMTVLTLSKAFLNFTDFTQLVDLVGKVGRRDWTRTNDPHHVKVETIGLQAAPVLGLRRTMTELYVRST
jgi:hypothetical protein